MFLLSSKILIYRQVTTSCLSFVTDLRDAIYSFHSTARMISQLLTLQAAQVTFIESDSAVSVF